MGLKVLTSLSCVAGQLLSAQCDPGKAPARLPCVTTAISHVG